MKNKLNYIIILLITTFSFACYSLESIYDLDINLENIKIKKSKIININELKGKIQIFSMIYTNCKTVCPAIISNMKKIEKSLSKEMINKIQFTLITLDPENDTQSNLEIFIKDKKINENWNILRTSKENTLKLALATGIKYKKENSNNYTHSNIIIIIGKNGDIKMKQAGLDKDYKKLIKILNISCKE